MNSADEFFRTSLRSAAACPLCDAATDEAGEPCGACGAAIDARAARHSARAVGLLPPASGREPRVAVAALRAPVVARAVAVVAEGGAGGERETVPARPAGRAA